MKAPKSFMGISRDWRNGLTEFATIGSIMDTGEWAVIQGHTKSGLEMQRTNEAMVIDAVTTFNDSNAAAAFTKEQGYR